MAGLTPLLPLLESNVQAGYDLIQGLGELVRQNVKMIVLTNPGERVMIPEFGVGLLKLLFENVNDKELITKYRGEIFRQIGLYLPYVEVQDVEFLEDPSSPNKISVVIEYFVPALDLADTIVV